MSSSSRPVPSSPTNLCQTPVSLKAVKGGFVPADKASLKALSGAGIKVGATVLATLDAPHNPGFHRLAYKFAQVCRHNIDDFSGMSEHEVLKQLQLKTKMGCDAVQVPLSDVWNHVSEALVSVLGPQADVISDAVRPYLADTMVTGYRPRSLKFGEMSQNEFRLVFSAFCRHVSEEYW